MRGGRSAGTLSLISAHPDFVGAAAEGQLSPASLAEQRAAGLEPHPEEIALFDSFNAAYREKFGFPS